MFLRFIRFKNPGNQCYGNAVLQGLSGSQSFMNELNKEARSDLLLALRAVLQAQTQGEPKVLETALAVFRLKVTEDVSKEFAKVSEQHDSQEFLQLFLQNVDRQIHSTQAKLNNPQLIETLVDTNFGVTIFESLFCNR